MRRFRKNDLFVIDQKQDRDGEEQKSREGAGENGSLWSGGFKGRDGLFPQDEKSARHDEEDAEGHVTDRIQIAGGRMGELRKIGIIEP